ncbi:MAG: T9SS type A sorting domain-containing protein, partial [Prolixibacteraceae bacterium]|nr:T9SS type A sorting domain-containing protein [Prolixibacteraceae bacterium]
ENAISSVERGADVQITIRLNAASVNTISVDIKPVAGDAVIGNDFELSESTITFLPGETSKILTVTAKDSSKYDEIVALGFNNEVNANQGARNIHVLRVKKTPLPTAYAGPDQTVWDADNNGSEEIILDGSESTLANGTIISYEWFEGENQIASGEKTTVSLSTGFHIITLLVADDEGNTDSDEVIINVVENIGIWLEAECGAVGSLWNITTDPNASNNKYVTVKSGNNSADAAPANATGQISYTFNVNESGKYSMYARVICPNANDDSFWLKMDNGSFSRWNDITPSSTWIWVKYPNPYTLSTGSHTFTVGYREDGAKLDKLLFSTEDIELNDMGPEAGNCGSSVDLLSANNIGLYPNPVCETLFLALPEANTEITFYDITGNIILKEFATDKNININLSALKPGIYLMNAKTPNREYVKKIIKE